MTEPFKTENGNKLALLFEHETVEMICDSINSLLADNPDWQVKAVNLKHDADAGTFSGSLEYVERDSLLEQVERYRLLLADSIEEGDHEETARLLELMGQVLKELGT